MLNLRDLLTKLFDLLAKGAREDAKRFLTDLRAEADKRKPAGYNQRMADMRAMYEGRQRDLVIKALKQRFPNTFEHMPIMALRTARLIAEQDEGVYVEQPRRWLDGRIQTEEGPEVGMLPADDPLAARFALEVQQAALDLTMGEAARVAVLSGVAFVRQWWSKDSPDDPGRATGSVYWGNEIGLVYHPHATDFSSLAQAVALIAPASGGDPTVGAYEIFWRSAEQGEEAGSSPLFGPWRRMVVQDNGEIVVPEQEWPGQRIPWAKIDGTMVRGSPWPDEDHDLADYIMAVNVSRINEAFVAELLGHPWLWYSGTNIEGVEIVVAPGVVNKMGPGETLNSLNHAADLESLQDSRSLMLKELAIDRSNSDDAYAVGRQVAESGIARAIKNIPHERRLKTLRKFFVRAEEREVLPSLIDLIATFGSGLTDAEAVRLRTLLPRMEARDPPTYEEQEAKQRRVLALRDAGLLSDAQAVVELGLYASEEDAVKDGYSDQRSGGGGLAGLFPPPPAEA